MGSIDSKTGGSQLGFTGRTDPKCCSPLDLLCHIHPGTGEYRLTQDLIKTREQVACWAKTPLTNWPVCWKSKWWNWRINNFDKLWCLQHFRMLGMISTVFWFFFFLLKFLIGYSFLSAIDSQLFLGNLVSPVYFEVKFGCCIFQSLRTSHVLNIWCLWLFLPSLICVWFTCKVSCLEYKQQREPVSCVIVYLCFRNTLRCN